MGINPWGAFSVISKLWTGSTSDRHLTQESGLLDLLEEGDHVMIGRGFTNMDLVTKTKVVLNMPPLSKGSNGHNFIFYWAIPRRLPYFIPSCLRNSIIVNPHSRSDFPFFRQTLRVKPFASNPSELPAGLANMPNLAYFTPKYFK